MSGQTTLFLVLVWAAAARLVDGGRMSAAAAVLGLGLFKPQFVAVGLALVAIRGGWRGALAACAGQYTLALLATGDPLWPSTWLAGVAAGTLLMQGVPPYADAELWRFALAISIGAGWLLAPARWCGRALLLLPAAVLLTLPYSYGYYYALAVLPVLGVLACCRELISHKGVEYVRS